jgi:hypothetical protein
MIAISKPHCQTVTTVLNEQFLELIPAIERYARSAFRNLQPLGQEDAVGEVVAYAFCAFRRLVELAKLDAAYAGPLARFGVARVRVGRRIGSRQNTGDVFSKAAQHRAGFSLESVHLADGALWQDALSDNRRTPIPDQVSFRLDFRAWLRLLSRRDQKLVVFLSVGNASHEAARHFGISRARVSQLRSELQRSWRAFQGDAA